MPTKWLVIYSCDKLPCDNRTAIIKVANVTSSPDGVKEDYDDAGAMRFIVATVLVYSLIGVFGMLLLRIKRSATKSQRTIAMQEDSLQKYLKKQNVLALQGRRERLKKEAERMNKKIALSLSRLTSMDSESSTVSDFSEDSSFLHSPGPTSFDGTLNLDLSSRSLPFPPTMFNFPDNLPPLFEGQEDPNKTRFTTIDETATGQSDDDLPEIVKRCLQEPGLSWEELNTPAKKVKIDPLATDISITGCGNNNEEDNT